MNTLQSHEKRLIDRRIDGVSDRREMVRYEIEKDPRRTGHDRRKINGWDRYVA